MALANTFLWGGAVAANQLEGGWTYFATEFHQICNEVASGCSKGRYETFLDPRN